MIRLVVSDAAEERIEAARAFLASLPPAAEAMVIGASREAADDLVRRVTAATGATFGLHRASLTQLAARVASSHLARLGLAPTSTLGAEALAARSAFEILADGALGYFGPVARFPGFARALAATIGELRMAKLTPADVAALGPGTPADVGVLLGRVEESLRGAGLADRPALLDRAARAAAEGAAAVPLARPTVLLDVPVLAPAERALVAAVVAAAGDVLATVPAGDDRTREALESLGARLVRPASSAAGPGAALAHLRANLFASAAPEPAAPPGEAVFFSAPGEGREAVEIARRIAEEARDGTPFDRIAVLLRAPQVYATLLETALNRAGIPAFFARGARRPDPAGRALLTLLDCALEKLSARRFAEYLSLGQVPSPDAQGAPPRGRPAWVAAEDDALLLGGSLDDDGEQDDSLDDASAVADGDVDVRVPGASDAPSAPGGPVDSADAAAAHDGSTGLSGASSDAASAGRHRVVASNAAAAHGIAPSPVAGSGPAMSARTDEPPVVAGTLRAPWKWEKLLVESAVIGGRDRWSRRLAGLADEMQLRIRELSAEEPDSPRLASMERDVADLEHLRRFALPIIDRLAALPERTTWGEWITALEALAPMTLRRPERVLGVLAELRALGPVGPVALDEVRDVLGEQLALVAERPPASRYGRVFVGALEQARGRAFDVVFVPGLAERIFPQKPREDPILLDALRHRLGGDLATQTDRAQHERLLLRLGIGAATRRVYLSYSRIELAEGRPRVPSFYAMEVQRALGGRIPDPQTLERAAAAAGGARLAWPAPEDPQRAIDPVEHDLATLGAILRLDPAEARGRARYLLELNDRLARSLRTRWARWRSRFSAYDGIVQLAAGTRELLLASRPTARAYSVSALQRFAVCPYQFYLSAICRLAPREEIAPLVRLDPLTRGSLFHEVQAECLRALQTAGALPVTRATLGTAREALDGTLDRVAAEYRERLAPAIARVWQDEVESLRVDLRTWLDRSVEGQAEWEPFAFELSFGLPERAGIDARSIREEVVLEGGFHLRGIVDLVERGRDGTTLRVTDHKTGLNRTTAGLVVGRGEALQPVLYGLAVEKIFGQQVTESRLAYCTRAGEFSERVVPMSETARRRGLEVLDLVDRAIARGFLPPAPRPRACDICDFHAVCGPGEERRIAQKDARALEDLGRLRGWP